MAHRRHVAYVGKHGVAVVVAEREYLVVRLPVVGRERHSDERNIYLVAEQTILFANAQIVVCHARQVDAEVEFSLSGVVAVAGVPNSAEIARQDRSEPHTEVAWSALTVGGVEWS